MVEAVLLILCVVGSVAIVFGIPFTWDFTEGRKAYYLLHQGYRYENGKYIAPDGDARHSMESAVIRQKKLQEIEDWNLPQIQEPKQVDWR